ncbi:hypothetical protein FRC15_002032 [Serendipita sp. 397]|nr:hypothetical protein FRC15_002032 [Serendipita sp. 397]KAG8831978.1 hypothetical protein FRC18_005669 [Serendipita sp. 400]
MKEKLEAVTGVPPTSLWIIYKGQKMEDDKKMEDYKIGPEAVVYILLSLRKPVIYLFLEMNLTVGVSLSLSLALSFTTIYPPAPIKSIDSRKETIRWNVETRKDGTLLDIGTSLEVPYLY